MAWKQYEQPIRRNSPARLVINRQGVYLNLAALSRLGLSPGQLRYSVFVDPDKNLLGLRFDERGTYVAAPIRRRLVRLPGVTQCLKDIGAELKFGRLPALFPEGPIPIAFSIEDLHPKRVR